MPNPAVSTLTGNSSGPSTLTAGTAMAFAANGNRNGLMIVADSANAAVVYVKLGGAVASATVWDLQIPANGSWDGTISGAPWQGPVSIFCASAGKVSIIEV